MTAVLARCEHSRVYVSIGLVHEVMMKPYLCYSAYSFAKNTRTEVMVVEHYKVLENLLRAPLFELTGLYSRWTVLPLSRIKSQSFLC